MRRYKNKKALSCQKLFGKGCGENRFSLEKGFPRISLLKLINYLSAA